MQKIGRVVCAALLAISFSACQKEEGAAEKAGKEIDNAAKEAGQAMEKAADSIKDTVKRESK
jgi:hypothetical protein